MKMPVTIVPEKDVLYAETGVERMAAVHVQSPDQVHVQDPVNDPVRETEDAQEGDVSSDKGFKDSSI